MGRPKKEEQKAIGSNPNAEKTNDEIASNQGAEELTGIVEVDDSDVNKHAKEQDTGVSKIEYDPLGIPPIKRDYSTPKVAEGEVDEIPEYTISQQSPEEILNEKYEDDELQFEEYSEQEQPQQQKEQEKPAYERGSYGNPDMKDMSPKNKKKAAQYFAVTIVNGYEMLHEFLYNLVNFEEQKVQKAILSKKMPPELLDCVIPMSADGSVHIRFIDFIKNYNTQLKEVLVLKSEVKEEMIEILTEIAEEEGWGLSNKQRLLFLVMQDALPKAAAVIGMKATLNEAIKIFSAQLRPSDQQAPINQHAAGSNQHAGANQQQTTIIHEHKEPEERT
jgi:hypothetical protein